MNQLSILLSDAEMSQTELAARSGISRETINHLCRGAVTQLRPSILIALAWGLDVEPERLAEYSDRPWPLGPRDGGKSFGTDRSDWVKELRRGRDPFVERAS